MFEQSFQRAIIISSLVFAISLGLGILAVSAEPAIGEEMLALFQEQVAGHLLSDAPVVLFLKIFLNNLGACTLLFLGGASLGTVTLLILGLNGLLIGAIMEIVRQQQGILFIAAALIPHGIFEIPSFLVAGALGLLLGQALASEWQGEGDAAKTAAYLGKYFLKIVVPLLAIAAIIEAFITPAVLSVIA
ncbi:hypothetical protein ABH15_03545 [Methanoculleus taiwanensis]|uniref:Stage II sporulation protein M n=1 Tax=Methanoculleus taiwanensis TaxID=1550565 RepID=A0A498H5N0_9EURY|nr:stage II sporulation protein M [Methanoculleus taiwanensis]RXE57200.1 hypothetical protein ABH15_03545 [Methanoculleus taiwanensis]